VNCGVCGTEGHNRRQCPMLKASRLEPGDLIARVIHDLSELDKQVRLRVLAAVTAYFAGDLSK